MNQPDQTDYAKKTGWERRREILMLRFDPSREALYRKFPRRGLKYPRINLFIFFALGFGLTSFYQAEIFGPSAALTPLLILINYAIVVPMTLVAATLSYFDTNHPLTRATQGAAVLTLLITTLVYRYFALEGEMKYPASLTGIIVIAIAFFGGFRWWHIAPTIIATITAAIAMEFWNANSTSGPLMESYALMWMGSNALLGSYGQETTARLLWRDVQRRQEVSAALQESEERYKFLVESAPEQIWTLSPDGTLDFANRAATEYFGVSVETAVKVGWITGVHREDLAHVLPIFERGIKAGEKHEFEYRLRRHDGVFHWYIARVSPLKDAQGRVIKWFGIGTDIEHLKQANAAAEAATKAKAAFLANMSHEIRTPMNAVIGMTSILLDSKQTAEQRECTEVIRDSGEHLLAIINDILDFSKIEAHKIELEAQPFSLRECIESALDLVSVNATKKNVEIGYLMHAGVPEGIRGDVSRLRQVLLNLLSNAVKFTPDRGQILVEVSSHSSKSTHEIQFSVRDTGMGLTAEQQAKLFKPFSQADSSTTRAHGGTGLGLSISKRLVELMGGHIGVESEPGQGSTFRFTIRVPDAALSKRITPQIEIPNLRDRRVLIVDDVEINRRILLHYTQVWGMVPQATESAREALQWIERGDPFDVALLDFHMPGMDGLELALKLRKLRSESELPIVMLGSAIVQSPEGVITASLLKPIKPHRLLEILQTLLKKAEKIKAPDETPRFELPKNLGQEHPLRILIAEDNSVNQKVAQLLFNRMGYHPDFVADGREALAAVKRQPYDVVFMDVQMPVMDGLEATRELCRRLPPDQRPRIVGMTANATMEDHREAELAGMQDYVIKPVTAEALVAALKRCVPIN